MDENMAEIGDLGAVVFSVYELAEARRKAQGQKDQEESGVIKARSVPNGQLGFPFSFRPLAPTLDRFPHLECFRR